MEILIYVLEGQSMQISDVGGEERRKVTVGTAIHISLGVSHATFDTGSAPMKILAVYSPPGPEALLRSRPGR